MNRHLAILIATLLSSLTAFGATVPYKEAMKESVKSSQPIVHARAGEYGFGVPTQIVP